METISINEDQFEEIYQLLYDIRSLLSNINESLKDTKNPEISKPVKVNE